MVVEDFNIKGITIFKPEADPPLFINCYSMLPLPISSERMQLIPRWHLKIIKTGSQVDVLQLSRSPCVKVRRKLPGLPRFIQGLGVLISESLNHLAKCNLSRDKCQFIEECVRSAGSHIIFVYGARALCRTQYSASCYEQLRRKRKFRHARFLSAQSGFSCYPTAQPDNAQEFSLTPAPAGATPRIYR